MTVAELLARVSSQELTDWEAYYQLEPFGQERGDMQAGIVASTVVNLFRGKYSKVAQPDDFVLRSGPQTIKRKRLELPLALNFAQQMVALGYGKITSGHKES